MPALDLPRLPRAELAGDDASPRVAVGDPLSVTTTWVLFVAILVVGAWLLVYETRGTTFAFDEWTWVMERRGSSLATFLDSYNGHFSLLPLLVYKVLWATAGLRTYVPYRLVVIALHLGCVTLVFIYAMRRVQHLLALVAAAVILFFGPGWENFLWPFQIAWLLSIAAGVAALLMLDRGDRRGDVAACVVLCCSVASSSVGVAILAGVTLELLLGRDRWRRAWIVAIPIALYGLWALGYQRTGITGDGAHYALAFVAHMLEATFAGLAGLWRKAPQAGPGNGLSFGAAFLLIALAATGWRLFRLGGAWPRVLALLAIPLVFAVSAAIERAVAAHGWESRYLYVVAVFVVLSAVELARGAKPRLRTGVVVTVLAAAVVLSNIGGIRDAGAYSRYQAALVRADLGALEIGRRIVDPNYVAKHLFGYPLVQLTAASYLAAARSLGSPAASAAALRSYSEAARETADAELIGIHRVAGCRKNFHGYWSLFPQIGPILCLKGNGTVSGHGWGVALSHIGVLTLNIPTASSPQRGSRGARLAALPSIEAAAGGTVRRAGACLRFTANHPGARPPPNAGLAFLLPPDGLRITPSGGVVIVALRRFAATFQSAALVVGPGSSRIALGPDDATDPWHVRITPLVAATVCGIR